ncbi:single stranded DNA binding protein [Weissella phage PWc]|nr:single stranded DNA binding protein [Weissella phage PWc]
MNENEMNALDALFNQAKDVVVEDNDFPKLDDGVYAGAITEIKLKKASNNKPQVAITLKEKETGALSWLNLFLTSKDNTPEKNAQAMARARKTLVKLGAVEGSTTFNELVTTAQANGVGGTVKYELKTRNGYQNVNQFSIELLEAPNAQTNDTTDPFGGSAEVDVADDDLPF